MFLRRFAKTTRDYFFYMRQSYTDLAPLLAVVGIVLTAGEGIVMWILAHIAPRVAHELEAIDQQVRMLAFGVVPAALILVWGVLKSGWLLLWQHNRE